ncbi:MAG TPA: ABC transporter ATP-binding protein [Candidatus Binatia bacterium]
MHRLSKKFGANEILKDISFEVCDGEFCILLGPSGCGKSTILRLIAGLEKPSSGEILFDGERIEHLPPRERNIAFVFQSYALYPHMTVFDNLAFSLKLRGEPAAEIAAKVRDAARLLEIENLIDRRPHSLSGGQRQRVALGRAIVRQPQIFLFDEPLSNLDAALRATMRVELARLHRRLGTTIVYVTHDQAEALTLGEKIIVLHQGTIQQIGSPADIYQRPANTQVGSFVGSPQMNLLRGTVDESGSVFHCGSLRLNLAATFARSLPQLIGNSVVIGIRPEDLQLAAAGQSWIRGDVEIIEDLGSDRFLHVKCDSAELIARTGRESGVRQGDVVGFSVAPEQVHIFKDDKRFDP